MNELAGEDIVVKANGIARTMFLSSDPDVYFNPDATLSVDFEVVEEQGTDLNTCRRTNNNINSHFSGNNTITKNSYHLYDIDYVLNLINTATHVEVHNHIVDVKEVPYVALYIPKMITEGRRHSTLYSMIHHLFYLNPKLEIDGQRINQTYKKSSIDQINIETLTKDHLVYLTGGEPMIMSETYKFMRRCIDLGKTDFSLTLGPNGMSLNDTFIELASHFKNGVHFSISIDGYGKVNDYVRWKSNFDQIMSNCYKLQSLGHMLSWNHVPTIWGIHKTHELFEHLSEKFPKVSLYLQYNRVDLHSAFSSPLIDETLKSLERTKETTLYFSDGKDCKSGIDSFYEHYKNYKLDKTHLEKFFTWNDAMDQARNIKLADYIPDLDNCRKLLN
jgi:hypothetical protein